MVVKNANGQKLLRTETAGYRPDPIGSAAVWGMPGAYGMFRLEQVEDMKKDSQVQLCLEYKAAPIYTAEVEINCQDNRVKEYLIEQKERFWKKSLSAALEDMAYGYSGSEALYTKKDGIYHFDYLKSFLWKDAKPRTWKGKLVCVRVGNIRSEPGTNLERVKTNDQVSGAFVDLPTAGSTWPAKGLWYVHNGRTNPWYGRPLTVPMWFPWRMKTMPDGILDDILKYAYKYSISCTVIRHPNEVYEGPDGNPVHSGDLARSMVELIKAGGVVALSSDRDEKGEYKYVIETWGEVQSGSEGLISIADFYDKYIQRAAGIPDEVITHEGNTGGYSRSQIAASAYLIAAERDLNYILETTDNQIWRPSVKLNFGNVPYTIKAKPLVLPDQQPSQGGPQQIQPPDKPPTQPNKPEALQFSVWEPYQGPQGGKGWKNSQTGDIVYQKDRPREHQTSSESTNKSQGSADDKLSTLHWGEIVAHEATHTRVVGPTACIHGSTPIYDPVDGTTLTVAERHLLRKPFHVYSLNKEGIPVIAKAEPPERFPPSPMVELVMEDGNKTITTKDHRLWNGESFVSVGEISCHLQKETVTLPVFSSRLGEKRYERPLSERVEGSQGGYLSFCHLYDEQLLSDRETYREPSPLQVDVPKHNLVCRQTGDPDKDGEHTFSFLCGYKYLPSNIVQEYQLPLESFVYSGVWFQLDGISLSETYLKGKDQLQVAYAQESNDFVRSSSIQDSCSVQSKRLPELARKDRQFRIESSLPYIEKEFSYPVQFFPIYDSELPVSLLVSCSLPEALKYRDRVNNSMLPKKVASIKTVSVDFYYDFHVPFYENYLACGLFHHNSGKSMLAQAIAFNLEGRLIILDPVWTPGNWGGLPAVTVSSDGDYAPIKQALSELLTEMKKRGAELQKGKKDFERLNIIFDEVPDTIAEVPEAGEFIRRIAQRGRHANMHLIGIAQSSRVGSWGLEGYGDAAENFCTILLGSKAIEVMPDLAGTERPGVIEWRGKRYAIDMSEVPEMAKRTIPQDRLFKLPDVEMSAGEHSYSSTQFDFPKGISDKIKEYIKEISDSDLAEEGREDDIHVTIKFGIHANDPMRLREILNGMPYPVTITLGCTSIFEHDDQDVLKIDIFGADIFNLNRLITESLANTETWPTYKPHLTLAYLKKGKGKKYANDDRFDGVKITFDSLTFSPADGEKVNIPFRPSMIGQVSMSQENISFYSQLRKEIKELMDDDDSNQYDKEMSATSTRESSTEGHWVTIGAHTLHEKNEEGEKVEVKHKGTHVYIKGDGTITKGPSQMLGKKPNELGHTITDHHEQKAPTPEAEKHPESKEHKSEKIKSEKKKSKAKVTIHPLIENLDMKKTINNRLKTLFPKSKNVNESLASSIGAPDDAEVTIYSLSGQKGLYIKVNHPKFVQTRTLNIDGEGKRYIHNDYFRVGDRYQNEGLGVSIFARQVEHSIDEGFSYIETHAAGSKRSTFNGYYTWPRFGYDETIDSLIKHERTATVGRIKHKFPEAKSILDIMSTKEGRDWWKENGSDLEHAKFDLTEGSRSRKILSAYLEERKKGK